VVKFAVDGSAVQTCITLSTKKLLSNIVSNTGGDFLCDRVCVCPAGKCRHGILAALSMKYDEPETLEFAEKRRQIDYTEHRHQSD